MIKKTALYDEHILLGAKMTEFAGWKMPLQYTSIIDEHMAVRKHVGIFDVSHMGELLVSGSDTTNFLSNLTTANIMRKEAGRAIYAHMLNFKGKIIDDMIIYKLSEDGCLVIPNAATTRKVLSWMRQQLRKTKLDVKIQDYTNQYSCIAVQGPKSADLVQSMTPHNLKELKFFRFVQLVWKTNMLAECEAPFMRELCGVLLARTGYTGEDGFEIVLHNSIAPDVWRAVLELGKAHNIKPCGLGARDTLRLEKGFLLSGQDFNEDHTPLETGWDMIIDWDHEFIGKNELIRQKEEGISELLLGVEMKGSGIPRTNDPIYKDEKKIGTIRSGSYSPVLRKGIGLGYVSTNYAKEGSKVYVEIRSKKIEARLKRPPFV